MSDGPIKAAVVGYGYSGSRIHVPLILLAPQMCLAGVCSSDESKRHQIARNLACRAYSSFDEVLADGEIELVVLATPNLLHAPQALAALRAGKHVLIDKPMCLTSMESQQLIACSKSTGMALSVFHNRRWDGDYLTLKHLMESGELGDLRWLEMAWQRPGPPRTWKQEAGRGGGRLIDLGSHLIDQALHLFAAPVSNVFCRMHRDYPGLDIESHCLLTMEFADGRTVVIDTTGICYSPKPRFLALGSKATFSKHGVDPQETALAQGHIDEARESESDWGTLTGPSSARRVETLPGRWRDFYEVLGKALRQWPGGKLPVSGEDGARVIAVLEAARQSAAGGRVVVLRRLNVA